MSRASAHKIEVPEASDDKEEEEDSAFDPEDSSDSEN